MGNDEKLKISFIFVESEKIWISGNHTDATIVNLNKYKLSKLIIVNVF